LKQSYLPAFQRLHDLLGQHWEPGHVGVAALDGTRVKLFAVLVDLGLCSVGSHFVSDVILAAEYTPAQRLLEPLKLGLDKPLGPQGRPLAPLLACQDVVDAGLGVGAAVGGTEMHAALHAPQVGLVHVVDKVPDG